MLEGTVEITSYETLHNAEIFSNCSRQDGTTPA